MHFILRKIEAIYKNVHFQSLFGNGLMAGIGMLSLALLYRSLSIEEIGVYIFILTVNGVMETLRGGFLTITFIKFYSGTTGERARQIAGSAWFLGIAVAVVAILINIPAFFLADLFSDKGLILSLKYFSVIPIVSLPSFMANCVVQSYLRFDRLLILRIISQGSFLLAIFVLMLLKEVSLISVLLVYAGSNLLSSVCVLLFGWTKIGTLKYANKETILELFHFGKYAMGTNINLSLFGLTSTFIINFLIGPAALAMYNLAGKLLQVIEIPLLSFAATGMPILSTHYNNGKLDDMMYSLKKLIGMLTIALIPFVIIALIFAEPIIQLLGGESYIHTEAPNLFRIFMLMSLLYPIDRFFALAIDVIHLPKVNFYKIIIMVAVFVVAVFISVSIYKSIYSIAIASLFPGIVAILMTYYPLNKFKQISIVDIYVTGYKEVVLFLKGFSKAAFSRN
ncbi:oligosaccharide flippase family protein [Pedobacter sp. ASV1-7]|uniref:lipopolysaccharide biosynthesis protein n=1 Tax=Pedobacter sp. ASV1-7 TaxID=3145237 RepID=UPI0032E884D0